MAEQATDRVERVVLVTTMAERRQLDASADLINHLAAQPDDVDGVKDADRVRQTVANRVRIAAKRIPGPPC